MSRVKKKRERERERAEKKRGEVGQSYGVNVGVVDTEFWDLEIDIGLRDWVLPRHPIDVQ
jgi:hypothetical protein